MSQYEIEEMEATAKLVDLDDLAGDMPVCMQAPECTDSGPDLV